LLALRKRGAVPTENNALREQFPVLMAAAPIYDDGAESRIFWRIGKMLIDRAKMLSDQVVRSANIRRREARQPELAWEKFDHAGSVYSKPNMTPQ
jgi:hypothetical protein